MIILFPFGGLANRMRTLNAGIGLSLSTKKRLLVFWSRDTDFNCNFDDIFVSQNDFMSVIQLNFGRMLDNQFFQLFKWGSALFCKALHQNDIENLLDQPEKIKGLALQNHLFVETYSNFYPNLHPYKQFQPISSLQKIIETIASQFGKNTVGIHIRRSDNKHSIENSPTNEFIHHMNVCIDLDPKTQFYVATDSPDEEMHLRLSFPDRIFTYPKRSYNRNNPLAIQDALIDLYCLSKCNKIIGSYWSSFTDVASIVGNTNLLIVRVKESVSV